MIDSTKSPTPVWQRYAVAGLLTILLLVAGYVIYTKELRHSPTAAPPTPTSVATTVPAVQRTVPSTTIPGGIPISSRDPFGS